MTLSGYTQAAATDKPEARETGFHAVSSTPEMGGGATALVEAYAVIWIALFVFVLLAWRKVRRIEARMAHLEQILFARAHDGDAVSFAHFIYIPGVLFVGLALGWVLGASAARRELEKARDRARE